MPVTAIDRHLRAPEASSANCRQKVADPGAAEPYGQAASGPLQGHGPGRRSVSARPGPGPSERARSASPGAGLNADDRRPVRTYEAADHPQPWNERAMLPVSMDIRTDQGHLGKVS